MLVKTYNFSFFYRILRIIEFSGLWFRVAALRGQGAISVWEADGRIVARKLP